jgi:hypothetical protein
VIDLAPHGRDDLIRRLAHRTAGLSAADVARPLAAAGLSVAPSVTIGGALPVLLHLATAPAAARQARREAPATLAL